MPKDLEKGIKLIEAIEWERKKEALQLIKEGADLEVAMPISEAAQGLLELSALIRFLPKPDLTNTHRYALHVAVAEGDLEIVDALLKAGANVNCINGKGHTPLHLATHSLNPSDVERFEIFTRILAEKPEINIRDHNGRTALHFAATTGTPVTIEMLVTAGAALDTIANEESTALLCAIIAYRELNALKLIELGANIHTVHQGMPLLHYVVIKPMKDLIPVLVRGGVNINAQDLKSQTTALHVAVSDKKPYLVKILVDNGASKEIKNKDQRTPVDYARAQGDPKMLAALGVSYWGNVFSTVVTALTPAWLLSTPAPAATTVPAINLAQQPPAILSQPPANQTSNASVVSDTTENKPLAQPSTSL